MNVWKNEGEAFDFEIKMVESKVLGSLLQFTRKQSQRLITRHRIRMVDIGAEELFSVTHQNTIYLRKLFAYPCAIICCRG